VRIDLLTGCPQRQVAARSWAPYLATVLSEAARAPWYRDAGVTGWSDLSSLPILDRTTVAEHSDELLTGTVPSPLRRKLSTGGSTGAPVLVWLDRAISLSEWRFMLRQWSTVGYRRGDWRVVLRGRLLSGGSIGPQVDRFRREVRLSTFHLSAETVERYLQVMDDYEGAFLHAYPSSAIRFAEICEQHDLPLPRFTGVLLGSEGTSPAQREALAVRYGCKVYSWYGQTEKVLLGGECPVSRDYHLFPGYGFAEIVDRDGEPVSEPGEVGRLIGTGFLNHCAPLVRYDTGDLAAFAAGECQCGWPGQRLSSVVGRAQDYVLTPSGTQATIAALNLHDRLYEGLRQIQYVQRETRERLLVRVVVTEHWGDTNTRELAAALTERLPGCTVTVTPVKSVETGPNGKAPIVIRTVE
jgi:phenylacetate-CoA ligase